MPATPFNLAVAAAELALLLSGLWLLWRLVIRPAARTEPRPDLLPAWVITWPEFLLHALTVFGAGLLGSVAMSLGLRSFELAADTRTILVNIGFQSGLLIGAALVPHGLGQAPLAAPFNRHSLSSGFIVFLIALPVITLVNVLWLGLLQLVGAPAEQQDLLRLFTETDSIPLLVILVTLATLVAPVAEELLFRAMLFRYLRTRIPRWVALLLPGVIFAALHVNWMTGDGLASFAPLVMLAVVFSLAYERTGRIGTVIVAHAFFNLHTILILFSGIMD
jgi:membrane protease YdiL (CAAX protease family)